MNYVTAYHEAKNTIFLLYRITSMTIMLPFSSNLKQWRC